MVKSASPSRKPRLRPRMSAQRPAGTSRAATTIAYALRTQDSDDSEEPPKSRPMSGNAMLTMKRSRLAMKTPTHTTARTCHLGFVMKLTLDDSVASCNSMRVLRNDYSSQTCSIARALENVGERWTLLILRDVFLGIRRFDELQADLGVARNVLSSRLEKLVDADILERHRYSERPPRDEYLLTERGLALWPTIVSLMQWGDEHVTPPGGPPPSIPHKGRGRGAAPHPPP